MPASVSALRSTSVASSMTHGPAMINSGASPPARAGVAQSRPISNAWAMRPRWDVGRRARSVALGGRDRTRCGIAFLLRARRGDEAAEERMRAFWPALELGVELDREEER